jgi:hypothetical protein
MAHLVLSSAKRRLLEVQLMVLVEAGLHVNRTTGATPRHDGERVTGGGDGRNCCRRGLHSSPPSAGRFGFRRRSCRACLDSNTMPGSWPRRLTPFSGSCASLGGAGGD